MSARDSLVDVLFSITIFPNFTWKLRIGRHNNVNTANSMVLGTLPDTLKAVRDVMAVVDVLQNSTFCIGNPDERFRRLAEWKKGKFTDASGSQLASYTEL